MLMKQIVAVTIAWLIVISSALTQQPDYLPQTTPLAGTNDLAVAMMDGAHQFVDRKIAESVAKRTNYWAKDFSSPEAYAKSVEPNRERFRTMIGAVDARLPVKMERFGDDANPALVAETSRYRIYQVRWPVLEGFSG